ncbi:Collagen triple helix repeat, partial [Trinorchestia longiramus]
VATRKVLFWRAFCSCRGGGPQRASQSVFHALPAFAPGPVCSLGAPVRCWFRRPLRLNRSSIAELTSSAGASGILGAAGAPGILGAAGAPGILGAAGASGILGAAGAPGILGAAGASGNDKPSQSLSADSLFLKFAIHCI